MANGVLFAGVASNPVGIMNNSVLVGIVTRDRADILPKALDSALAQVVPELKVAVIDDGSTDGTRGLAPRFPGVSWTHRESSQGYMSARNELMARDVFDFFVSLDDDAWFLRDDEIVTAVRYLNDHPEVAAVAFDILAPDQPEPKAVGTPEPVPMFIGCGHVLRLSAVREVGAYESVPGSYGGEEKDLCLRLMDAGYAVVKLPGVHVWHDKSPVARIIPQQHRSGVCNDLVMTLRRTPSAVLPAALLAKLFRHMAFSWRNGLMDSCIAGFGLFIQTLPDMWKSRRPVRMETIRAYMKLSRRQHP